MLKFSSYIALKWILFWIYQLVESGGESSWDWGRVNNWEGVVYTFGMILLLPMIEIIVLAGPFYIALKQRGWVMIAVLVLTFALEFAIGWYATNQDFSVWMIIKLVLSIGLFYLFYRKQLFL